MVCSRTSFVAALAALVITPSQALAAGEKRTFRVKARLDRNRDKKTLHQVEITAPDGKKADALDGSWAYDRMPRTPRGLFVSCTVTDGPKIHVKLDAEYGQANNEQAGGNNYLVSDAKTSLDDDFAPAVPVAYPWTVSGEEYTLVVSVEPVAPKEK